MATYPPSGFKIDAIICDSAVVAEGKLFVQGGGWNMLMTANFPFIQPRVGVGVILSVPYHATNKNHLLEIVLENEDGEPQGMEPATASDREETRPSLKSIKAQFNLGRPPILQAGESQTLPFAVNLDQLVFKSPGAFSFVMSIDGEELERLPFRVLAPTGIIPAGGV